MASVPELVQAASQGRLADVQRLLGHEKEPQPEHEPPVNVDATGADGWTALMRATAGGSLDIVKLLVAHGAKVDKMRPSGETALMYAAENGFDEIARLLLDHGASVNKITTMSYVSPLMLAASEGHESTVKLLCEGGATIDAQMNTGDTPLMLAATYGYAPIVEYLIQQGATIEKTTDKGWTALMFAAFEGHADALRVLKTHGANIEHKNFDRRTSMMLAITKGHADVIHELLQEDTVMNYSLEWMQKGIRRRDAKAAEADRQLKIKELEAKINVDSIGELTQGMHESQTMTERLHARLVDVDKHLKDRPEGDTKTITMKSFKKILEQAYTFLLKYAHKLTVTRLVSSRLVVKSCRDAHIALDEFIDKQITRPDPAIHEGWETQLELDAEEQQAAFNDPEAQSRLLNIELKDEQAQTEALTLLLFATTNAEEPVKRSQEEIILINKIFQQVASLSRLNIDSIPEWFVPPHEVDFNVLVPFAKGAYGSVAKGIWKSTPVAIKTVTVEDAQARDLFKREVEIWYKLQNPHVVRLFRACHVGTPFFVCDYASNGTLSEYLYKVDNIGETWAKLYEASLGLHYLHETPKLVHGDLKCNNILVGDDGKAKVSDFGLSFVLGSGDLPPQENDDDIGAIAWKAPEIIQHNTRGTFETDVYAFGMCIIEAVTGRSPWGIVPDTTIKEKLLDERSLPKQPKKMNDQQWNLVKQMCDFDPSKRPNMKTVSEKLSELADDAFNELAEADWQRHLAEQEERKILQGEEDAAKKRKEERDAEAEAATAAARKEEAAA